MALPSAGLVLLVVVTFEMSVQTRQFQNGKMTMPATARNWISIPVISSATPPYTVGRVLC
jgi:hypothetical protein